jgi:protein MpaA
MRLALALALAAFAINSIAAAPDPQGACGQFVHKLPNVSKPLCERAGLLDSRARSAKGVPLYVRDVKAEDAKLRVLVVGAIHGDELSSASLAFHWIGLAQEPMQMAQPVHWRFIPALNPDGVLARPPRRVNANGVDLNRNFPTPDWSRDAAAYWEKRTRNLIVAIHAPYGVLDFDGPSVPPSKLGRLYLDQVGIFPGSLGNYGGVHKGVPVVTIELPNAMRTPLDAEMRQMWLDLLRWTSERVGNGAR